MTDRVNIVYFINSLGVGGAEVGMCRLLDGLDAESYNVTLVALDGHPNGLLEDVPQWVDVLPLYGPAGIGLSAVWETIRAVRNADVIVGSLFYSAVTAKVAGLLNRASTVATWRHMTPFKTQKREVAFRWTTNLVDVVLADSTPVSESLRRKNGINESTVRTVPIAGIDLDRYTRVTHQKHESVAVGTVGRLTKQKNPFAILAVAEQLRDEDVTFEIAGAGELEEEIREEIEKRDLTNVTLHGFVNDVPAFLSGVDVYFQPSRYEGLCITVLEAMATGLPVVASDVGGIGESVEHGESGFLYKPDDIGGFSSGIKRLAQDPHLRADFGERGRKTVENGYTQEILVSCFEEAIGTG